MALRRITASVSGVYRGTGEVTIQVAIQVAIFSKIEPFSASRRRNENPSRRNGLRLETKGPAHDWAGHFVPRTGFEPVLPD